MQFYIEPSAGVQPVVQIISQARQTLDINAYLLRSQPILDAMRQAVKRGVAVRVILEQHPYLVPKSHVKKEYQAVLNTGAKIHWAPSRFRFDHAKYICNGFECEVGTANYDQFAFHDNREYFVITKNANEVTAAKAVFNDDWYNGVQAGQKHRPYWVLSPGSESELLKCLNQPGPVSIEQEELGAVPKVMAALEAKGAQARLILPNSERRHRATVKRVQKLRRAGVQVRFMPKRNPHIYMHAKLIAGDQWGFIGSENFSLTSLHRNREMGVNIQGNALRQAKKQFDKDWKLAAG